MHPSRFFWARARAGSRALIALGAIAAIAALVVAFAIGAVFAAEQAARADGSTRAINEATALRGQAAMAIGIVAVLAAVVVGSAAIEPVRQRLGERTLLRARGMSKWRLVRVALGEAIPTVALGSALGAGVGILGTLLWSALLMPWWSAVAIAGGLTAVGAGAVALATLRGVDRRSGRGDLFAGIAALIVLATLAALAAWQFARSDGAVTRTGGSFDPLIALAPALTLTVFALLAVVLSRPLASFFAVVAAKRRTLSPVLPLRMAARRTGRHALTTGVVAFAAATLTLAVVYQGTLHALGTTPEALRLGADVRVISASDDADRQAIANLDGVDAAMPAVLLGVRGSKVTYPLLAVEASQLGDVMLDANGEIDPRDLGAALQIAPFGVEIPTAEITVTIQVAQEAEPAQVAGASIELRITDAGGNLQTLYTSNPEIVVAHASGPDVVTQGWHTQRQQRVDQDLVLQGVGPWRLLGIEARQDGSQYVASPSFIPNASAQIGISAGGTAVDLGGLHGAGAELVGEQLRFDLNQASSATAADAPARWPAVMTEKLAKSMNVELGSTLALSIANTSLTIDTEIVRIVELIPGLIDGSGIMVDLRAISLSADNAPQPNEVWLAAADATGVAEAVRSAVTGVRVEEFDAQLDTKVAGAVFAFGIAALGASALALVVLLLRRSRSADGAERELGLLAVLGVGRRGAARLRAKEDVFAIVLGALGGVVAGLAVAWLIVPNLVRGVFPKLPGAYPVSLVVPWWQLAIVILAVTALFSLLAASIRAPKSVASIMREAE